MILSSDDFDDPNSTQLFLNSCRNRASRGRLTSDFIMGERFETKGDITIYIKYSGGYKKFKTTEWEVNFLLAIALETTFENLGPKSSQSQRDAYKKMQETLHPSPVTKLGNRFAQKLGIGMACTPF